MKATILASIACCMVSVCFGQTDTIYTVDNQKIICNYEEIINNHVNYRQAGNDELKSINIDQVHKLVIDDGAATVYINYSDKEEDRIAKSKHSKNKNDHEKTVIICSENIVYKKDNHKTVKINGSSIHIEKDNRIVEIEVR